MQRLLVVALFVACSGSTPREPDGGDVCTGQLYDPCNSEHDCQSGNCRPFSAENFSVCTQGCSTGAPCPNTTLGATVMCDSAMLCEPTEANLCHLAD